MFLMRNVAIALVLSVLVAAGAPAVLAQTFTPEGALLPPPPPPPPPPPKLDIPKVPKMGEVPGSPKAPLVRRGSFGDRVRDCIEEGAAMGLGPNERAAYSRACANAR